jgi:hypothetical protein
LNTYNAWLASNTTHLCRTNEWKRTCKVDGKFDLVQAKGNGWTVKADKKFCTDINGNRYHNSFFK